MKTITEALAELKVNRPDGHRYVEDWKKHIPSWSMWTPGSLGKPDCQSCKGLGVVRVEVSRTHPFFGKLFVCECQSGPAMRLPVRGMQTGQAVQPPADDTENIRARSIARARKDLE